MKRKTCKYNFQGFYLQHLIFSMYKNLKIHLLFIYLLVYLISVCVSVVYTCMHGGTIICVCVQETKGQCQYPLPLLSTLTLGQVTPKPQSRLCQLANKPEGSVYLYPTPTSGAINIHCCCRMLHGCWRYAPRSVCFCSKYSVSHPLSPTKISMY